MKKKQIVGNANGTMVMLKNGAIQLELDLYGDAGDLALSGTLTNRLTTPNGTTANRQPINTS